MSAFVLEFHACGAERKEEKKKLHVLPLVEVVLLQPVPVELDVRALQGEPSLAQSPSTLDFLQ